MENIESFKQRVALYLSCRQLKDLEITSKSDPLVEVQIKDQKGDVWCHLGSTEAVSNNRNPNFSTFIECDYYFEREQQIKFIVYDINTDGKKIIGLCYTTLAKLFGCKRQTFISDLTLENKTESRGIIIVKLDNVSASNNEARIKISAKLSPFQFLCCEGTNNPFFVISRTMNQRANENDFVRVFKSDSFTQNTNPVWNPLKIKLAQMCNGNSDLPIKIEVFSYDVQGNHQKYGQLITTVNDIKNSPSKVFQLETKDGRDSSLTFEQFRIVEMPSFMEYLRSGWAVNMSLAIDFTASNLELSDPFCLHKQDPMGIVLNQYEQAILQVGKVVEPYALNYEFACFGFGGIPRFAGYNQISHCFNLTGTPSPQIVGLQNIFHAYRVAVNNIGLAGPTLFAPLLKELLNYAQSCMHVQMYHLMVIITDGYIHDMDETIDLIVELSQYPVSIIIIGVGDEDFEIMRCLDGNDQVLKDSQGKTTLRDIVQFVTFQDYAEADISVLAQEVLREVPDQIVSYMLYKGIQPLKLDWANTEALMLVPMQPY